MNTNRIRLRPVLESGWGIAIMSISTLAVTFTVSASNFGSIGGFVGAGTTGTNPPNGVWLTNGPQMTIAKRFLLAAADASTNAVAGDLDSISDIVSYANVTNNGETDSCLSDGMESRYDVCVMDSDYGDNGLLGWNQCDSGDTSGSDPNMQCTLALVRINYYAPYGTTPTSQYNLCHEIGHGIGLRHTSEQASCLKRAAEGGSSATYSTHDRTHLSNAY